MSKEYCKVYVLDVPYAIDRPYDYFLPPLLRDKVTRGSFVTIPFGAGNRMHLAVVTELRDSPEGEGFTVKPVLSVCPDTLRLENENLRLCEFMKDMTLCTYGDAIHAMLPAAVLSRFEEYVIATDKPMAETPRGLGTQALFVHEYLQTRKQVSMTTLRAKFGAKTETTVRKLCELGYATREMEVKNTEAGVTRYVCHLVVEEASLRAALFSTHSVDRACGQLVCNDDIPLVQSEQRETA